MVDDRDREWSLAHRVAFRFFFLYWALYCIPSSGAVSIFDILPYGSDPIESFLSKPLQHIALWVGQHVFHLSGIAATFHPTGSGDTALGYIVVLCVFLLAVLGTLVWSLLDRRRLHYRTLDAWLRLLLSLTLAATLFGYGFVKVFAGQFTPPTLFQLNETYGESSPMGLLWTFMGASSSYTLFGGLAEVVPGILLFFRRTRTLGALLAAGVLTNVVALNLFYDVPVKVYSVSLLALALFLLAPDAAALARLFLLRQQAQLRTDHVPASERVWLRRTAHVLQALIVVSALWSMGYGSYKSRDTLPTSRPPLYGLWQIDHATTPSGALPWSRVQVMVPDHLTVKEADDKYLRLSTKVDPHTKTLTLTSKDDGSGDFRYAADSDLPRHLTATGTWNNAPMQLEMHRIDPDTFPLQSRGFHWISEFPYNR